MMNEPKLMNVKLDHLIDPVRNQNVMDPEQYKLLVAAIREVGFLQPILIREPAKEETLPDEASAARIGADLWFRIVDGVHRASAAREVGLTEVPCVIVDADADLAVALQIGMNRMRGELDLAAVAKDVASLSDAGWTVSDLTITGFSAEEVESLLTAVQPEEADLSNMSLAPQAEERAPEQEGSDIAILEIPFTDRKQMVSVKKKLRKVGGGDLTVGLLRLLDSQV